MSDPRTYLDYNATAPLRRGARVAVMAALSLAGNASSVHSEGREARKVIELARDSVASLLGANSDQVIFTSGGTEANNWVMSGGWDIIFVADIEHESVATSAQYAARRQGTQIIKLPVDENGIVSLDSVNAVLDDFTGGTDEPGAGKVDDVRALLTLQMANNETGVVQATAQIFAAAKSRGIATHCDAVQAVGRLPVSFNDFGNDFGNDSGVDLLTVSGHKLGAPKGIGALLIRDGFKLRALIVGGGQEFRHRAGTENVAAIAGFGSAAEAAARELGDIDKLEALRDRLEREITKLTPGASFVGAAARRLPNTSCVALPGHLAETLVIKLDLAGIAISAGAACSSGKAGVSHVLRAMNLDEAIAASAIRISLGWGSSDYDIEAFLKAWKQINLARRPTSAVA